MTNGKPVKKEDQDLLAVLIEHKAISKAQADLATVDHEMTGMSFAEVLLARHWVDLETLRRLAPWLASELLSDQGAQRTTRQPASSNNPDSKSNYQSNLKKYRELMAKILGENP